MHFIWYFLPLTHYELYERSLSLWRSQRFWNGEKDFRFIVWHCQTSVPISVHRFHVILRAAIKSTDHYQDHFGLDRYLPTYLPTYLPRYNTTLFVFIYLYLLRLNKPSECLSRWGLKVYLMMQNFGRPLTVRKSGLYLKYILYSQIKYIT